MRASAAGAAGSTRCAGQPANEAYVTYGVNDRWLLGWTGWAGGVGWGCKGGLRNGRPVSCSCDRPEAWPFASSRRVSALVLAQQGLGWRAPWFRGGGGFSCPADTRGLGFDSPGRENKLAADTTREIRGPGAGGVLDPVPGSRCGWHVTGS